MTGADPATEQVAQRLASRGRDTLVERLRNAYTQAAEVHADVLSIDGDRLETIVQGAADRADGLQWRRALADLASGELGISLTDALAHPAVARAQELVGAPSYEDSLAALGRRPAGQPAPQKSLNGGSQAKSPDRPRSTSHDDPPAAEPERAAKPQVNEQPPWQSMAQSEALGAEPEAGPAEPDETPQAEPDEGPARADAPQAEGDGGQEPEAGGAQEPETGGAQEPEGDGGQEPEAGAAQEPEASSGKEPEAGEAPEPAVPPRPAGPGAPPDVEPETIVQAAPVHSDDPGSGQGPAGAGREPYDDPDATREWSAHELADVQAHGGSASHSLPPQPTHVVPALPPETTAGGHVAPAPEPAGGHAPGWQRGEPGFDDGPGFDDDPYEQPYGLYASEDEDRVRVSAVHLGGVANLPREGIELRLSAHGLDIMRRDDAILGRLMWSEIDSIEVPSPRVRRRRNRDQARLVVRTGQGDASFQVPGFSSDELHERIAPLVARFGRR